VIEGSNETSCNQTGCAKLVDDKRRHELVWSNSAAVDRLQTCIKRRFLEQKVRLFNDMPIKTKRDLFTRTRSRQTNPPRVMMALKHCPTSSEGFNHIHDAICPASRFVISSSIAGRHSRGSSLVADVWGVRIGPACE
jgi:hypothetical protein